MRWLCFELMVETNEGCGLFSDSQERRKGEDREEKGKNYKIVRMKNNLLILLEGK